MVEESVRGLQGTTAGAVVVMGILAHLEDLDHVAHCNNTSHEGSISGNTSLGICSVSGEKCKMT